MPAFGAYKDKPNQGIGALKWAVIGCFAVLFLLVLWLNSGPSAPVGPSLGQQVFDVSQALKSGNDKEVSARKKLQDAAVALEVEEKMLASAPDVYQNLKKGDPTMMASIAMDNHRELMELKQRVDGQLAEAKTLRTGALGDLKKAQRIVAGLKDNPFYRQASLKEEEKVEEEDLTSLEAALKELAKKEKEVEEDQVKVLATMETMAKGARQFSESRQEMLKEKLQEGDHRNGKGDGTWGCQVTSDAAIPAHNREHLDLKNHPCQKKQDCEAECAASCHERFWCMSFDFVKPVIKTVAATPAPTEAPAAGVTTTPADDDEESDEDKDDDSGAEMNELGQLVRTEIVTPASCDLSDVTSKEVALKKDYPGNPYDHWDCRPFCMKFNTKDQCHNEKICKFKEGKCVKNCHAAIFGDKQMCEDEFGCHWTGGRCQQECGIHTKKEECVGDCEFEKIGEDGICRLKTEVANEP